MTQCCKKPAPQRASIRCSACGGALQAVEARTLLHLLRAPFNQALVEQGYYFCANADCDRVYQGEDGCGYSREQLRLEVGQKSRDPKRMLCYCFDINLERVMAERAQCGESASRAFVVEQTGQGRCACEIRNPSGRCCLKEFPR
ncbi:putative iron-sulfur cluster-binding metallochaperone [Aestuariirhabdus litorea]|uniref:CopZ zinc binding domain-containing protein n=1 Tax=Aestuariirhabdus litorea TaxID=2528527 RepID=A0A3P3VK19_9GAMM|nr:hypothetical protein [Aestuariirhabdus litorea]RRJ82657.1 hypothetical protein D0544_12405 [Aestuariirhabdus litorea]RWW92818.1 hypothetical protein DZC74_12385 [Endozoicomonadaceae bacterium GTF-13]